MVTVPNESIALTILGLGVGPGGPQGPTYVW